MSVEDWESCRFDVNIRLSLSTADLGPTSAPKLLFSMFFYRLKMVVGRIVVIASSIWKLLAGMFGIVFFNVNVGFPLS